MKSILYQNENGWIQFATNQNGSGVFILEKAGGGAYSQVEGNAKVGPFKTREQLSRYLRRHYGVLKGMKMIWAKGWD